VATRILRSIVFRQNLEGSKRENCITTTASTRAQIANAALDLGIEVVRFEARSPDEVGRALDAMTAAKIGALNVLASPLLDLSRLQIIDRMREARLPAIYQWPETAEDGGLLAYGPRFVGIFRDIVARQLVGLLRGAKARRSADRAAD
jgi:putative tryptophan/tyrosine transport system substrate-binding protein